MGEARYRLTAVTRTTVGPKYCPMPKTAYDLSFADALPAGAVALATLRAQEAERAAEVQQGVHELGALAVLLEGEHDRFHREANMSLEWLTRDQPSGTVVYEELSQV